MITSVHAVDFFNVETKFLVLRRMIGLKMRVICHTETHTCTHSPTLAVAQQSGSRSSESLIRRHE